MAWHQMGEGNRPFAKSNDISRDTIVKEQRSVRGHLSLPFWSQLVLSVPMALLFKLWHDDLWQHDPAITLGSTDREQCNLSLRHHGAQTLTENVK